MNLCDYGCGKEAKYQFKNGKYCCCDHYMKCENVKKNSKGRKHTKETKLKISLRNKHRKHTKESKEKMRISHRNISEETRQKMTMAKLGKKRIFSDKHKKNLSISKNGKNNPMYGKNHSKEHKRNQSISQRYTINDYKKKHNFFYIVEEMRYNPNKPGEKEIQVHCKNHSCLNSKEKGGWFTPTSRQIESRIYYLEKVGADQCNFYCSDDCKNICPIYQSKGADPFKEDYYIQEEYTIWKQTVLEQDDYTCQKCGSKENLNCHHIIPVKIEPMFSLDPDNGIVFCEECHYKYGHKTNTECSTGNLAKRRMSECQ